MNHARRRDRVRKRVQASGARALVVGSLSDIRYLTGFSGSNAVLVLGSEPDDDLLATDGRYTLQATQQAPDLALLIDRATMAAVGRATAGWSLIACDDLPAANVQLLSADVVLVPDPVSDVRQIKETTEIELISHAARITAAAITALASELRLGMTEIAVARRFEQLCGDMGAEDRAFATIVASGPNSALPHHQPGARTLQPGDLLVIDAGARVDGYCSDMTRTFLVGAGPTVQQSAMHAAVLAAQSQAGARYLPGEEIRAVDAVAREVVREAGFEGAFTHGLGHGLGLDIHEAPMISAHGQGRLSGNMAVTVEPGIYVPGIGGVRIEDTLLVTDDGPRVLTEATRDLLVVG